MIFQSPLQLYANQNFRNLLKDIQLQWKGRGVETEVVGIFMAKTDGKVQGIQNLLQWLTHPIIYTDDAMRTLMSLRDDTGANVFGESFLNFLQRFRFSGDMWSVSEGILLSAGEPFLYLDGKAIEIAIIRLWANYLLQPKFDFRVNTDFLQIRRFYNSNLVVIQDIIYSPHKPPIVNFEAASWEDLLQPVKIANPKL